MADVRLAASIRIQAVANNSVKVHRPFKDRQSNFRQLGSWTPRSVTAGVSYAPLSLALWLLTTNLSRSLHTFGVLLALRSRLRRCVGALQMCSNA